MLLLLQLWRQQEPVWKQRQLPQQLQVQLKQLWLWL
jgi:hypothetical protein